jgi:hypothetical protein
MADGRAGGVGDAHRVEYLTLHIAEEEAVRGGGERGRPRFGGQRCKTRPAPLPLT